MKIPSLNQTLDLLDHKEESLVSSNMIDLHKKYDLADLVDVYVDAFYKLRYSPGRREIAYWVGRYVILKDNVFELAKNGLRDRSYMVRHQCCTILAYAQKDEAILELEKYIDHRHTATREDIAAVIDSIKCKNQNYFVDRGHTGKFFFEMGKI